MTTNIRSTFALISGSTGLGLAAFTASAAVLAGLAATPTLLGFGALVCWGLFEIAALEPGPTLFERRHLAVRTPRVLRAIVERPRMRVPAIVEFGRAPAVRRAA